jgi:hypothetical protein
MKHRWVAVLGLLQLAAGAFVSVMAVTVHKVCDRAFISHPAILHPSMYAALAVIVFVPVWMVLAIAAERTASAKRIYLAYVVGTAVLILLILWALSLIALPFVCVDNSLQQGSGHPR